MLRLITIVVCMYWIAGCSPTQQKETMSYPVDQEVFKHGVASGDPTSESVIIWTRLDAVSSDSEVIWQVSESEDSFAEAKEGKAVASSKSDYVVKVDVTGLEPGRYYYYRFIYDDKSSPVGRTKTFAKAGLEEVKLGIVSCSNYEFGYFGAYHGLADQELDAILHLGDYIYEYGPDKYGDTSFTRKHLPDHEIISLQDYRTRYGQYRIDEGLQRVHQMHPFITIWDDHEITNNSYKDGAQNHQEDEGDYQTRKEIAKQVYYEWLPVRDQANDQLYRTFDLGDMADIIMLDERLVGREAPAETTDLATKERSMLGATQLQWFKNQLDNSTAKWKIIGNQVIFSPCDLSTVRPRNPINLDAWDGYASERDDIRQYIGDQEISDVVFVTGDTHSSWAFDIPDMDGNYSQDSTTCGVEIGTPSITSSNWNDSADVSDEEVIKGEQAMQGAVPHLHFVEGRNHGYTLITLNEDGGKAEWFYIDDMKQKRPNIRLGYSVDIVDGRIR